MRISLLPTERSRLRDDEGVTAGRRRRVHETSQTPEDAIRLVFCEGARANDRTGFLEGTYADGRRLARFGRMKHVTARKAILEKVLKRQVERIDT